MLAVAVEVAAPAALARVGIAIAVLGVVVGIPHGAVDHMIPSWTSHRPPPMLAVLGSYVLVAALAAGAFWLLPDVATAVFLIASAYHFGRGEAEATDARDPLLALAHGSAVVLLPLLLWRTEYVAAIHRVAPELARVFGRPVTLALCELVVMVNIAVAVRALRAHNWRLVADCTALVLLMLVTPPLISFGAYFGFWHSMRHYSRLLSLPGRDGTLLPRGQALRRFAGAAAVPVTLVLAASAALLTFSSRDVVSDAVIVLLALTFPHMRAVARLDRLAHPADDDRLRGLPGGRHPASSGRADPS